MIQNKLKKALKNGETAIGTFINCNDPDVVEICALSGFEFIVLDGEHSAMIAENCQHLVRAAEVRGITPIIRIPDVGTSTILKNLDIGACGIQVPQVDNAEIAKKIVLGAKYAPVGGRGIACPRAADYGFADLAEYAARENEETMIIAHCENKEGLENLEEICRVPEIDVIFLGPYDMSQSLGVPGQTEHPLVEEAAEKVLRLTRRYHKIAGVFCPSGGTARRREAQGFRYLTLGTDMSLLAAGCRRMLAEYRADAQ